jgi:hypothetical protein
MTQPGIESEIDAYLESLIAKRDKEVSGQRGL